MSQHILGLLIARSAVCPSAAADDRDWLSASVTVGRVATEIALTAHCLSAARVTRRRCRSHSER